MRINFKIIFLLVVFIISYAEFEDIKIGEPDLVIGLEGLEGHDDNYVFNSIEYVQLDQKGNIYILDRGRYRIQVFDEEGNFIQSIGRKGEGPGEFYLPNKFFIRNEWIFVLDFRTIKIFSLEGRFVKSFKLDFQATDIKVNEKKEIILLGLRNDKIFHAFNWEGKALYSFGDPFKIPSRYNDRYKDSPFLRANINMFLIEDSIYIFNPFEYKINVYKNNQLIKEFGRKTGDYFLPTITDFGNKGYSIGYIDSPNIIKLNENILLISRQSRIDIFKDYKFINTVSTGLKGVAYAIDKKNRIYCVDSYDYPKLIRYQMIFK